MNDLKSHEWRNAFLMRVHGPVEVRGSDLFLNLLVLCRFYNLLKRSLSMMARISVNLLLPWSKTVFIRTNCLFLQAILLLGFTNEEAGKVCFDLCSLCRN